MRTLLLAAAAAAALAAVPALAQDASAPASDGTMTPASSAQTGDAPDGSRAFGIEPYFGVMGGWEQFDNQPTRSGIPQINTANGIKNFHQHLSGGLVQGVAGVNVPLGPLFVGVEGNVAKGVTGDIDWEYGGAGRAGFRAGDSGLFYGKVGYEWVNFDGNNVAGANSHRDYHDVTYGLGFEVGPKDIGLSGLTNRAGFRLRGEVSTFGELHSWRPMIGVITHF